MNTRYLMIASSCVMAALGLSLTFAPQEIGDALGGADVFGWQIMIMKLCGALYFGFALMNWMAKGTVLGGIYGRPIVIGNVVHFTMGALALLKMNSSHSPDPAKWALFGVYALFAVAFGYAMMTHPATSGPAK